MLIGKTLTIPAVLRLIEKQTDGMMKYADFGGGAESPYCSFHANYRKNPQGRALYRK